jgi:hypothetical protein
VLIGLACAWWSTAKLLDEEVPERIASAGNFAWALREQGEYDQCLEIYRAVYKVQKRIHG